METPRTPECPCAPPLFVPAVIGWHEGQLQKMPASRLDSAELQLHFGQYINCWRPELYWWTCYNLMERLCQTSFVAIARIMHTSDRNSDVFITMIVTMLAMCINACYHPFAMSLNYRLQMVIFLDECLILAFIEHQSVISEDNDESDLNLVATTLLFVLQVLLMLYMAWTLYHTDKETVHSLMSMAASFFKNTFGRTGSVALNTRQKTMRRLQRYLSQAFKSGNDSFSDDEPLSPTSAHDHMTRFHSRGSELDEMQTSRRPSATAQPEEDKSDEGNADRLDRRLSSQSRAAKYFAKNFSRRLDSVTGEWVMQEMVPPEEMQSILHMSPPEELPTVVCTGGNEIEEIELSSQNLSEQTMVNKDGVLHRLRTVVRSASPGEAGEDGFSPSNAVTYTNPLTDYYRNSPSSPTIKPLRMGHTSTSPASYAVSQLMPQSSIRIHPNSSPQTHVNSTTSFADTATSGHPCSSPPPTTHQVLEPRDLAPPADQ
ncbi:hypothetical protein CYMTET_16354 [Cymbomonas tetramitiformis]|uniref:Uncharacterized protein n=1 Tax=Cymbomonas tetramitiformis TaxID=36881 RepID=A0AAE0GCA9_9CHLO|nr:hypothetical protein CYMTET_16354 [Cymbomonas tetramitiformis]